MKTLFISDLHLSEEQPEITALFLRFLDDRVQGSDALYILGDLFEVWLPTTSEPRRSRCEWP